MGIDFSPLQGWGIASRTLLSSMGRGTISTGAGVTDWQGRSIRGIRIMQFSDWVRGRLLCSAQSYVATTVWKENDTPAFEHAGLSSERSIAPWQGILVAWHGMALRDSSTQSSRAKAK